MILAALLGILVGAALTVIVMGIATSGSREDECRECPDRLAIEALCRHREQSDG